MRKRLWVIVCLSISAACFGSGNYKPMNVKTGLWEVTEHTVAKGLPPAMAAMGNRNLTYKTCVTPEKLKENPFTGHDCKWTILNSSSSDMEAKGTACDAGKNQGMTTNVHYKLHAVDSEHVNGSGDWTATGGGQNINGSIDGSGHWLGASCGQVK